MTRYKIIDEEICEVPLIYITNFKNGRWPCRYLFYEYAEVSIIDTGIRFTNSYLFMVSDIKFILPIPWEEGNLTSDSYA